MNRNRPWVDSVIQVKWTIEGRAMNVEPGWSPMFTERFDSAGNVVVQIRGMINFSNAAPAMKN